MNKANVAVCILFFNKLEQTIECIESFLPSGVNIYVFNNGSELGPRQGLGVYCQSFSQVQIIDAESNVGVAVGRNALVEATNEDWLLFVDNDIIVKTQDWLNIILLHLQYSQGIEVFVPQVYNVHEQTFIRSVYCVLNDTKVLFNSVGCDFTNLFPGGASFVSRNLFKRLGLYDDQIFVGFEDFELAIRGIKQNAPIVVCILHDIELIHNHRYLPKGEDQKSVIVRYDCKSIVDSYNRIVEKHQVFLDRDFEPWLNEQVQLITNPLPSADLVENNWIARIKRLWTH